MTEKIRIEADYWNADRVSERINTLESDLTEALKLAVVVPVGLLLATLLWIMGYTIGMFLLEGLR